jgi:hypothetical protein
MTVRYPVKYSSSGNTISLQECTSADLVEIQKAIVNKWLSVLHTNNTPILPELRGQPYFYPALPAGYTSTALPVMSDTILLASWWASDVSTYPTQPYTLPYGISTSTRSFVSEGLCQVSQTSVPAPLPLAATEAYLYRNVSGELQEMTLADIDDTFIYPAIKLVTDGVYMPYSVTTSSNSPSGYTKSGGGTGLDPLFYDTRADAGAYTYDQIPEHQYQAIYVNWYFLHRLLSVSYNYIDLATYSNNSITVASHAGPRLLDRFQYIGRTQPGYRISYTINSTNPAARQMGSAIIDTKLNGSGNYQKRFVSADDYRAQIFPNGSPVNISIYKLHLVGV